MEDAHNTQHPIVARLEEQASWYDQKSSFNRRWYKRLKVSQIIAGALIPLTSSLGAPAYVAGTLGVLIVIFEGLQSLNQYQHTWLTYRTTHQQLNHEKYLWLAKAGPYDGAANTDALLTERIETILARENAGWTAERQHAGTTKISAAS
jgi:Protein of unknown function (DUF4231)